MTDLATAHARPGARWPAGMAALAAASLLAGCDGRDPDPSVAHVAVAANFSETARALADRFTSETGREIVLTTGSTGQLYAQVREGAPFDLLLAADEERPRLLEEAGLAVAGTRVTYAEGRLVLFAPGLDSVRGPADLRAGGWTRLAVANPRTAPYGAAAEATLRRLGLAGAVAGRVARGEGVGQALQFVRSGGAEMGFVALAQVAREPSRSFWLVPDSLHEPIRQDAVLLTAGRGNPTARAFLDHLSRPGSRELIRSFGYGVPGEPAPAGVGSGEPPR